MKKYQTLTGRYLCTAAIGLLMAAGVAAQAANDYAHGVSNLRSDGGAGVEVRTDDLSGKAKFVRIHPNSSLSVSGGSAAEKGQDFFYRYGAAFGVSDPFEELTHTTTLRDSTGTEHAVFKQMYRGLPVFGGELRAHFNHQGRLIAANGNFVENLKLDTTPNLNRETAEQIATRRIFGQLQQAKRARLSTDDEPLIGSDESELAELTSAATDLLIFRTGLVRGVAGTDHLAYQVEVVNPGVSVREFVYVDARSGKVLDQITGIHEALDRRAYDAEGAAHPGPNYPGSPFWEEGDSFPTTSTEADNMILASGETYDMFFGAFGRDSFDGAGATMDAIFNRGDSCPNASWNGIYISFCPGLTTDDVTAHEWGHAYTQYTNNLIYQWQSGALNESYSDIWGETVDLINGRGLDSPGGARTGCAPGDTSLRWMMGEETSIGALRDMWDPTCEGDPGKVSDSQYICSAFDNGGVHFNSGIPNHAFALMVDGGTYNSVTVSPLGLLKAAHIEWGAQNILTPTSNFVDNADALEAACTALIGINLSDFDGSPSGEMISAGDCTEVTDAIAAVEMRMFPTQCGFEPLLDPAAPALCDGMGSVQTVHFEDFEGGTLPAGWTASSHDVVSPGTFDNPGWSVTTSLPTGAAGSAAAFGPNPIEGDCSADIEAGAIALDSPVISLPVGEIPHVAFDHWVATEAGWDGGNVKVSVNSGAWTLIPGSAYSFNAYNDTLTVSDNPLGGEAAFTGSDEGVLNGSWGQSQVDLVGLASPGDDIRLRFDLGTDGCNGVTGWYVDSVRTYTCSDEMAGVCGDGLPDVGEECDDGNTSNGDGCSSICEVEDGWSCTDATPPTSSSNIVADWSFESGDATGDWTATSSANPFPEFPCAVRQRLPCLWSCLHRQLGGLDWWVLDWGHQPRRTGGDDSGDSHGSDHSDPAWYLRRSQRHVAREHGQRRHRHAGLYDHRRRLHDADVLRRRLQRWRQSRPEDWRYRGRHQRHSHQLLRRRRGPRRQSRLVG